MRCHLAGTTMWSQITFYYMRARVPPREREIWWVGTSCLQQCHQSLSLWLLLFNQTIFPGQATPGYAGSKVNYWKLWWQNFYKSGALPITQQTASKHWRMIVLLSGHSMQPSCCKDGLETLWQLHRLPHPLWQQQHSGDCKLPPNCHGEPGTLLWQGFHRPGDPPVAQPKAWRHDSIIYVENSTQMYRYPQRITTYLWYIELVVYDSAVARTRSACRRRKSYSRREVLLLKIVYASLSLTKLAWLSGLPGFTSGWS